MAQESDGAALEFQGRAKVLGKEAANVPFPGAATPDIIWRMASPASVQKAHRCSFHPDRRDPYTRLGTVTVFVRDQERSLRFYLDQLGFSLGIDSCLPSGERWVAVTPPDGTAMLALVVPRPGSDEHLLTGRSTEITFLTEDVVAKFEEWRRRGVSFHHEPQMYSGGGMFTTFEDVDGNSFTLLGYDEMTREVDAQRRAHAERFESERRAALEQEHARQVQAKLFPQIQPPSRTLDYAGTCIQARAVGGDYYDFLDLGRERLGLVIGDVAGKGIAAALLMANLQAHVRNLCASYSSRPFTPFALEQPDRFLLSLNRVLYENATNGSYSTLFFAEYDDRQRRLRYANCGHPSALLLRHDGNLERLDSTCTVVGLFKEWHCAVGERYLFPGDTLVLSTDGVAESFNEAREEFGEPRLIDALRRHRELPSQELLAAVVEEIHHFSPHEQHDDITLISAKCKEN